jgi:hypothetical protein
VSHIASVKVALQDYDVLKQICKDVLNLEMTDGAGSVHAMDGGNEKVVAHTANNKIGISETTRDGQKAYSLVGEFWNTPWYNKEKELANTVNKEYSLQKVQKEFTAMGYSMQGAITKNADGSIELIMGKY